MAIPQVTGNGTAVSGAGSLTVVWPAHTAGNIGLLVIETGGEGTTLSITAPTGWAEVTGSPVTDVATTAGSKLQVFWKRAASSAEGNVTVPDSGDHQLARIVTFNGCAPTGNPWNVVTTATKTTASTTVTFPSVTTTVDEVLCVLIATRANDSASTTAFGLPGAMTSSLANRSKSEAGTTSGHGGGFVVFVGEKATAGATGTSSTTCPSSTNAMMVIGLRPDPSITIAGQIGAAAAAGSAVSVNETIAGNIGGASAAGNTASVVEQYFARITWAEAAYQAIPNVTVPFTVGNAVAAGSTAGVSVYDAVRVTWAEAQYQAVPNVTIPFTVGNAVAAGATAGVTLYDAVRVTWAEAQYQATSGTTVPFTVGNAAAGGPVGATVSEDITLAATTGNAVAGGPSGATVSVDLALDCGIGNVVAAGLVASVSGLAVYNAGVTWAEAQYLAGLNTSIFCLVGNAVAGGPAGATVSEDITLVFTTGNAVAGGPAGATVSEDITLGCNAGNAVAAGLTALVFNVIAYNARVTWAEAQYQADPNVRIACFVGNADAAGQRCQVLPPLTVAPSATPGYAPKTRYRVRVGSRWMEVDPLDPMSVRRAYDAAQEDAQDAATQDVEAPAAVAAQAVVVQPIKGPDYAGLAKEARRISEDIRKVYADALQTALIARLMREQIERDDEDDIAVLLASI